MANRFTAGNKAISECDRCGIRVKLKDLKNLVIKTKQVAIKVCNECWEEDHPQLQLGMYPVADPQAVRDPRPDFAGYAQSRSNIVPVQNFLNSEEYTSAGGEIGTVVFAAAPPPPPAACDPYFAYVGLLLHFDGANGGTTFIDSSNNAYTPTLLGSTTPTTSTTQIKFGTASGYFFASSQSALQYASVSPLDIYSTGSSFTVETWVYPLSNNNRAIVGSWEGNFSGDRYLICLVGGVLYINWDGGTLMSGGSVPNNVWTHIALVRNGNVFTAYINGTSVATTTYSVAPTRGWGYTQVGVYASNNWGFDGYMDELRITKGIARYTANFTPQSAAFPDIVCAGGDPYYPSVSLLLHMDGSNGSTTFTDNSPSPKTLTPSGNAQVNTSVVKYGTGSYVGDGSGDYLTATVPGGLGSSDFTIEYWVYPLVVSGFVLNSRTSGTGADGIDLSVAAGVQTAFQQILPDYSAFVPINTWTYIAIVRQGSTWYRFFNGTLYDTGTNANNFTGTDFKIGGSPHGNVGYINGYIDDFRITVGVARYTANFTPPTGPFPNS